MVNQQVLQGNWNELVGKVREKWGRLTENDISSAKGNVDELIGVIQRKTGESRDAIERSLESLGSGASAFVGRATEAARDYSQRTAESMRDVAQQAGQQMSEGYEVARRYMNERPGQAMAIGIGVGIILGMSVAMMFRKS